MIILRRGRVTLGVGGCTGIRTTGAGGGAVRGGP